MSLQRREKSMILYKIVGMLRSPLIRILFLFLVLLYVISPFDFLPDFLFPFGLLDDIAIVASLIGALWIEWKEYKNLNSKK